MGVVGRCDPERRTKLAVSADFRTLQSPSVAYRGIFLNDEDWSLQPWSWQTFEPAEPGRIGPKTYRKIFELLLRLRANAIWPGMHGFTTPFYFVPGAKEAADSCGIVIGTSHCEPLMRNNVGEWDTARRGPYNYITNRDSVQAYWVERLKEVRDAEILHHRDAGHPRRCDGGGLDIGRKDRGPVNGSSATSADCSKSTSAAPPQRFRRSSCPTRKCSKSWRTGSTCPTT